MDIKQISDMYYELATKGRFDAKVKPEYVQEKLDFVKKHVATIDWIFEDPDDILKLAASMVKAEDTESFKIMLDSGFDINLVNSKFETIFTRQYTWFHRHVDFVKLALEAGADFTKRTRSDQDFFWIAMTDSTRMEHIQKEEEQQFRTLNYNGPFKDMYKDYIPEEIKAKKDLEYIISLPGFMQTVGEQRANGKTLYHTAVSNDVPLFIVEAILKNGHDVDASCTYQEIGGKSITERAIHIACENANIEMFKLLVKYGADVNYPRSDGMAPLQIVADAQQPRRLLHKDKERYTKRCKELCKIVLELSGAEVIKKTLTQLGTRLSRALNKDFVAHNMLEILLGSAKTELENIASDDGTTLFHNACKSGDFELFKQCVKTGIDLNVTNNAGDTPLHFACAEQQDKITMQLIKLGADFEKKNIKDVSPLDILTTKGNAPMIEFALSFKK
ncbi:MAG: ankyrin repeat domain-containing protein [Firmicutes bacterium]|nr:ankyrin repeat domain-containing protein [Bacillota bacterium]